jgi:hypothetical protein
MVNRRGRWIALALVAAGLAVFYYAGATEHAERVNTARGRADQSGYLWDAVAIHKDRHGGPSTLIGERNRMPVYPWLLSWLYDPALTPDQFFEKAKRWNIALSLVLLALFAAIAARLMPPLVAANFVLAIAFGYYVFKAGYAQVELLFYFFFFLTFLACWRAFAAATPGPALMWAGSAGVLAALSHLSKAALLPFVAIFLVSFAAHAAAPLLRRKEGVPGAGRVAAVRAAAAALFLIAFLGVLSPYLLNSKKQFGHYFYNVNSTFYVWYDDWPSASVGTYSHGDGVGWPTLPADQIPTWRTYLRDHSAGQIAGRFAAGFVEMITVSYIRLWYFKALAMYALLGLALVIGGRTAFATLVRSKPSLMLFLTLYAVGYLAAVAFYHPISGTTLRMLLVHVAPLLFVVSRLSAHPPFRDLRWQLAGVTVTPTHAHLLILATILLDVAFVVWPRLMAEFAGY